MTRRGCETANKEATKRDREPLLATGIAAESIDTLPARLGAVRTTDAAWLVLRTRGRPPEQVEREAAGFRSRNDGVATMRFGFRNDPDAEAILDDMQKGDGVVDMVDDMEKISVLLRERGGRIEIPNFDARKEADRFEREARAIREGSAAYIDSYRADGNRRSRAARVGKETAPRAAAANPAASPSAAATTAQSPK